MAEYNVSRIIKEYADYDPDTMADYISLIAREIEDSMLQCGGRPGVDYSFLDIFKMAIEIYNAGKVTRRRPIK